MDRFVAVAVAITIFILVKHLCERKKADGFLGRGGIYESNSLQFEPSATYGIFAPALYNGSKPGLAMQRRLRLSKILGGAPLYDENGDLLSDNELY